MTDREKVIKGLECCHVQRNEVPPLCEDCPYMNPMEGTCDALDELLGDALTLLKAQEPRVIEHAENCCADGEKDRGQVKRPKETFWDSLSEADLMEPMRHFED